MALTYAISIDNWFWFRKQILENSFCFSPLIFNNLQSIPIMRKFQKCWTSTTCWKSATKLFTQKIFAKLAVIFTTVWKRHILSCKGSCLRHRTLNVISITFLLERPHFARGGKHIQLRVLSLYNVSLPFNPLTLLVAINVGLYRKTVQVYYIPLQKHAYSNILKKFTNKKWKFSKKKIWYFFYLKHSLWVLVRTASTRLF